MGIGGGGSEYGPCGGCVVATVSGGEGCQCQWEVPEKAGRIKERRCEKGRCALKLLLVSEISHRQALSLVRRLQHLQCFRFAPPSNTQQRKSRCSVVAVGCFLHSPIVCSR